MSQGNLVTPEAGVQSPVNTEQGEIQSNVKSLFYQEKITNLDNGFEDLVAAVDL